MDPNPDDVTALERRLVDAQDAGQCRRSIILEGLAKKWPSGYWPSLAIAWLEDGFPVDEGIADLLDAASSNKAWPQQVRHRAFAVLVKWRRAQRGH